jgi:hypothetical protein
MIWSRASRRVPTSRSFCPRRRRGWRAPRQALLERPHLAGRVGELAPQDDDLLLEVADLRGELRDLLVPGVITRSAAARSCHVLHLPVTVPGVPAHPSREPMYDASTWVRSPRHIGGSRDGVKRCAAAGARGLPAAARRRARTVTGPPRRWSSHGSAVTVRAPPPSLPAHGGRPPASLTSLRAVGRAARVRLPRRRLPRVGARCAAAAARVHRGRLLLRAVGVRPRLDLRGGPRAAASTGAGSRASTPATWPSPCS